MSFFGSLFGSTHATARPKTMIDLVTRTVGLVSNPHDIDPLLDRVRNITARVKPGEAPSPAAEDALLEVYLQLERYLATKEPLRSFTKEDLRAHLSPELLAKIETREVNPKENAVDPVLQ